MAIDIRSRLGLDAQKLAEFCRTWKIVTLDLFGSALRDDFRIDSDIDLLVTFEPGAAWGFSDQLRMEDELAEMFGRPVDLVERKLVEGSENYIRRKHILQSLQAIYPE